MDRQAEELHLAQTDRHIALAEQRITRQQLLLDELQANGHDTKTAEEMLKGFKNHLKILYEHREIIVKTIEQIDNGLA